jgi:CDP-4-dehydro-6-deoxyglucose reductase, E1
MTKPAITLARDTVDNNDIDRLCEWLKTYPRLTKGPLTIEFEKKWAKWLGSKYSVFVNSGSSANLLMLYALIVSGKLSNKKIAVPALSWATDLAPVMQLGLEPVLVDCNLKNLAVDIEHLEKVFKTQKPAALMLVSVLGLTPDMDEIISLCNKYNVILMEDVCESLGSKYRGRNLGTFGVMSSFSLYYGHHLSSIEGGVICTDDEEMYDLLKMIRSHGWDRDLDANKQEALRSDFGINDFNALYTFYVPGFNVRSTDLQAFIGIGQLDKIDKIVSARNVNYELFNKLLNNDYWKPDIPDYSFISNFCYPVIHAKRNSIVEKLKENNVEVRPLICGSMGTQPFYSKIYGKQELKNVSVIDNKGFYIPNNHNITNEEIIFMCDIINSEINK